MKPNRFLSYEWDAIAGILAATAAIVLHQLHIADEHIILPIVLALMALLFISFMRHTLSNERTAGQVERTQNMVAQIKLSLADPDVVLIGPRQLRTANEQFARNMRGEAILFNGKKLSQFCPPPHCWAWAQKLRWLKSTIMHMRMTRKDRRNSPSITARNGLPMTTCARV